MIISQVCDFSHKSLFLAAISATIYLISPRGSAVLAQERALDAWSARYQGQAEALALRNHSARVLEAWAARYQGQADALADGEPLSARALDAWFARYNAWATARALNAWAARYQGQADEYLNHK